MASLKDVVNKEYATFLEGKAWIVIYKEKGGWKSASFIEKSGSYEDGLIFSDEDMKMLRKIASTDYKAIYINGSCMDGEGVSSRKELEDKISYMYSMRLHQLQGDFLGGLTNQ